MTPDRFDIVAKYIYAKYREKKFDSDWGERLYSEHLRVWNKFQEKFPRDDIRHKVEFQKEGLQEYKKSFHEILDSVKSGIFDSKRSPVKVLNDFRLLNGAHRVASCLLYDHDICCEIFPKEAGQLVCNSFYFN